MGQVLQMENKRERAVQTYKLALNRVPPGDGQYKVINLCASGCKLTSVPAKCRGHPASQDGCSRG